MESTEQTKHSYYVMGIAVLYGIAFLLQSVWFQGGFLLATGILSIVSLSVILTTVLVFVVAVSTKEGFLEKVDQERMKFNLLDFAFWLTQQAFSLVAIYQVYASGLMFLSGMFFTVWVMACLIYFILRIVFNTLYKKGSEE